MKLAYVANVRMPTEKAHGLQIMQMCRAFAAAGHEVTLVVPKRRNPIKEDVWAYYGFPATFRIETVPSLDLIRYAGWLGNLALWLSAAFFGRRARPVLKRLAPEVVYSRDPFAALWAPPGPKIVFEAHDYPRRDRWYLPIWKRYDRIVAVTKGLADRFARAGVPSAKLVVAHDAVDTARFASNGGRVEARRRLGLPEDGFIAAYAGSLYPHKGVDDLVEAVAKLKGEVETVVVGDGADLARVKAASERLGAPVRFDGHVPHARVRDYLQSADVAVLPNRGGSAYDERYTSPMKLFEYLAAGKAIVASDLPAMREALDDACAVFTPPQDPQALAAAILKLKREPALRERLERCAFERAKSHTWDARARQVLHGLP